MFEVKETDLGGRLGRLQLGGRVIHTPAYLPVIHPVKQQVPIETIGKMGFEGIMTNSYIAMRKFPDGCDIHKQTGFDGVIMTDSGGYQVLEYGGVEADPVQVAEYQIMIGTDIAVILDRPTGYPASRKYALKTVNDTLAAAKACARQLDTKPPAWAGPVQGGTHIDIVRSSARRMSRLNFDLFAIGSPVELMNGYRFKEVVELVTAAKSALPPEKPVHLFGAGHPFTIPLAVALGCDLFDSASYILFAKQGKYMTSLGVRDVRDLSEFPCSCPVCSETTPAALLELDRTEQLTRLAVHNLYVMKAELSSTREALREGRLWSYLVQRMKSHPHLASVLDFKAGTLRLFDSGTGWDKGRASFFFDKTDLLSPEVRRHMNRMRYNYSPRHNRLGVLVTARESDVVFVHSNRLIQSAERRQEDLVLFHPFLSVIPIAAISAHPLAQNASVSEPGGGVIAESVARLADFAKRNRYRSVSVRTGKDKSILGTRVASMLRQQGVNARVARSGW